MERRKSLVKNGVCSKMIIRSHNLIRASGNDFDPD